VTVVFASGLNAVFIESSQLNSIGEATATAEAGGAETDAETDAEREADVGLSPSLHAVTSAAAQANQRKDKRPPRRRTRVCPVEIFIGLTDPWDIGTCSVLCILAASKFIAERKNDR
jgi:hypothetical protein